MERTSRQQEILAAAVHVIDAYGFRGLTIRRVADEVGVSEPALYRHFPGKLAILECLLDDFQKAVIGCFMALEGMSGVNPLNDFIGELFETLDRRETLAPLLFSEEAFHAEPALKNRVFEMINQNSQTLARAISAQQKRGALRTDIEAENLALIVMGCIRVTLTRCSLSGGTVRLVGERDRVAGVLTALLKA